jgi:hypothetical protein
VRLRGRSMSLVGEVDGTAARQASLKLLQRKDPGIHEIIANASHVSVYVFDNKTGSWVSAFSFTLSCNF